MKHLSPQTRSEIIDDVISTIYQKTFKRQDQELELIVLKNSNIHGNKQHGFLYKGAFYSSKDVRLFHGLVNSLHKDIRPEFKEWLAEKHALKIEISYIQAFILRAINFCNNFTELKLILPDVFHNWASYTVSTEIRQEEVNQFINENAEPLKLIKRRLTINLLEEG